MSRPFIPTLLLLAALTPTLGTAQAVNDAATVVEAYMQAWNARDADAIASFFADDAVYEDVTNVANGWGTTWRGRDAIGEGARELFVGMPDVTFPVGFLRAGENHAVVEWTMNGTHTGDWPNLAATGRSVSVKGVSVIELEDGVIRRQRDYWDGYLLATQLGILPAPSESEERATTPSTEARITTPEENKALVRRVVAEAVNTGDLDVFRETLAPNYRRHSQATTGMEEIRGADAMIDFVKGHFAAFPDWHERIDLMIAEGDLVAYVTTGTGTHTGPMGEVPPSGRKMEVVNFIVQRIENGKIAETWIGWDNLAALTQLGLFPPQPEAQIMNTEEAIMHAQHDDRKAVIARIADDIWNQGNLDVIDEVMAPHGKYHGPHMPGGVGDRESWREAIRRYRSSFPDAHVTYEALIPCGDIIVGRWRGTGTHNGPLPGLAPTGKPITISGITIYRFENGKVVEAWEQLDLLGMWQQLGVFAQPGHE